VRIFSKSMCCSSIRIATGAQCFSGSTCRSVPIAWLESRLPHALAKGVGNIGSITTAPTQLTN
jgi:hypothetical protein